MILEISQPDKSRESPVLCEAHLGGTRGLRGFLYEDFSLHWNPEIVTYYLSKK